jgi:hypothetical protein
MFQDDLEIPGFHDFGVAAVEQYVRCFPGILGHDLEPGYSPPFLVVLRRQT